MEGSAGDVDSTSSATAAADVDAFHQATLDSLPAHVAVLDAEGTVIAVNRAWRVFGGQNGRGAATGIGANYLTDCHRAAGRTPDDEATTIAGGIRAVLAGDSDTYVREYECTGKDGPRWFVLRAARFAGAGPARVVVQHQEVTVQRAAEADARFRGRLLDAVGAAVVALDAEGIVTSWNHGAEQLYGWTGEEVLGRPAQAFFCPGLAAEQTDAMLEAIRSRGRWEGQVELRRRDASTFQAYVRNAVLHDATGAAAGFVGVAVDITEQLHNERLLRSAHDYLHAVASSIPEGLCTLDDAGRVVYVNPRAEELLGWTAEELIGSDLHDATHHTRRDGTPYPSAECPLVRARGIGGAARIDDDIIIRRDGSALAVQQIQTPIEAGDGRSGYVLVISDITARKRETRDAERRLQDLAWIERIRDALDNDRFVLHAQPIVSLASGQVVQHELLIRMLDEDGTPIAPARFLPVAEHYGLIGEIDRWVIAQGVGHAAEGRAVELNLSAHSLSDPTLYGHLDAELRRTGADPKLLIFELTETAILREEESALRFIQAVADRGCGLALDDFGTGYGGFSYLKRLPVDYLKIDIEFVRDLASEPASRQVVDAVVSLARGFGIKTVAEGVEDAASLELLERHGVDYAQGYYLGRPAPAELVFNTKEQSTR